MDVIPVTFLAAFLFFALALLLLSLGALIAKRRLRGSCGGVAVYGADGEPLSCETCPNKKSNPKCPRKIQRQNLDPLSNDN